MPYTAEQVAAAIAEPRQWDIWRTKSGQERQITKVCSCRICHIHWAAAMDKWGACSYGSFRRWARTATLVHRAGEGE